jgi:hypothetical protein
LQWTQHLKRQEEPSEEKSIKEKEVETVMSQTGVSRARAEQALQKNPNVIEAILACVDEVKEPAHPLPETTPRAPQQKSIPVQKHRSWDRKGTLQALYSQDADLVICIQESMRMWICALKEPSLNDSRIRGCKELYETLIRQQTQIHQRMASYHVSRRDHSLCPAMYTMLKGDFDSDK